MHGQGFHCHRWSEEVGEEVSLKLSFTQSQIRHDYRCANQTDMDTDFCGCVVCCVNKKNIDLHFMEPTMSFLTENVFVVFFAVSGLLSPFFLFVFNVIDLKKRVV